MTFIEGQYPPDGGGGRWWRMVMVEGGNGGGGRWWRKVMVAKVEAGDGKGGDDVFRKNYHWIGLFVN